MRVESLARVLALGVALVLAPKLARADSPQADLSLVRAALETRAFDDASRALVPLVASSDASVQAQALCLRGMLHEQQDAFAPALDDYRASLARDPGSPMALRASARVQFLSARSEGAFEPLAVLARMQRAEGPADWDAFITRARAFPAGLVRAESLLLAAQALQRAGRMLQATTLLREIAADASIPNDKRHYATELLSQTELHASATELEQLGAPEEQIARIRVLERRARLHTLSWAALLVVLALGALACVRVVVRGERRALLSHFARPLPLVHIAMLSLGGALIVRTREGHASTPFLALGAGAWVVYMSATAWSLAGSAHPFARTLRAVVCGAGALAVAFLSMHHHDPMMLDGIGL